MSIKAFYRTWVPVIGVWDYRDPDTGEALEHQEPIRFYKGNVQPWKESNQFNAVEGGFTFEDFQVLHLKERVLFTEVPSEIPSDATQVQFSTWYFYYDNKWYTTVGKENWTNAGRNPKHAKYYGRFESGQGTVDLPVPTPMPELVEQFENVVLELQQVSNYYS